MSGEGNRPSQSGHRGLDFVESQQGPNLFEGPPAKKLDCLVETLRLNGFEACELIIGVDFTRSNTKTGKVSFGGKCLHDIDGPENPYLQSLKIIAKKLPGLDDDCKIPCYGFGDETTGKNSVFSFYPDNEPAQGLESVVSRYTHIAPRVDLSGPTTFAPLIRQAMKDVHNSGMKFHLLLILADGQITEECLTDTRQAIVDATQFPLFIVVIGVGDGPWDGLQQFNALQERAWANFHFVEFNQVMAVATDAHSAVERQEEEFAACVLTELPEQYLSARALTSEENKKNVQHIINAIDFTVCINPPQNCD